jgi:hypothetical protein
MMTIKPEKKPGPTPPGRPTRDGPARIVSLVPSLTELVCDLGLADQLVGRTGFCIHPGRPAGVPKVGGTKDVNLARLRELAPTHVIVNIDENRRECAEEIARFVPHVIVTHPCTPEDNLVYRLLGGIFGRQAEAAALASDLRAALDEARGRRQPAREKVLYLIWREPWMTVARSTYIRRPWPPSAGTPARRSEPRYPAFEWDAPWLAEVDRVCCRPSPTASASGTWRSRRRRAAGLPGGWRDGVLVRQPGGGRPALSGGAAPQAGRPE